MIKKTWLIIIILLNSIFFSGCIDDNNDIVLLDPTLDHSSIIILNGVEYSSIQNAIDNAKNNETIYVFDGIYYENLIINKSIILKGENNFDTIIDGSTTNDVIQINADNVIIKDFTITHAGPLNTPQHDAGLDIYSNNNVIKNCNISLNGYYGIFLDYSNNNSIIDCTVDRNKISIYALKSKNNTIKSNVITNNNEYGIYLFEDSYSNIIENNIFSSNAYGCRVKSSRYNNITNNEFSSNSKGLYFCCGGRDNLIYNNSFNKNSNYNARDDVLNTWGYGGFGNYWGDYNGTDSDNDGIGDTPYIISSTQYGDKVDNYPLMNNPKL